MRTKNVLLTVLIVLAGARASATPLIFVEPASQPATAGGLAEFGVYVSGVEDLYAFQFDLGFAPGIIAVKYASEGTFLSSQGPTLFIGGDTDNSAGTVTSIAGSLLGGVSGATGAGLLARFTVDALHQGSTRIQLFNVLLLDSSLSAMDFNESEGLITVGERTVPEPSLLLMLALAAVTRARPSLNRTAHRR